MRLLLDTHIVLWWLADDRRLGPRHRELITDARNEVFVSAVSVAEIAIKLSLGKLTTPDDLLSRLDAGGFIELPFDGRQAEALRHLPWIHRDPFDRMLLAAAKVDGLTFLTADQHCLRYDVPTVPAA